MAQEKTQPMIPLTELSSEQLRNLLHAVGMEYAKRNDEPTSMASSKGAYFFTPEPSFAIGVHNGKLVLRVRSSFYGWVSFQWSRERAIEMRNMLEKSIATGAITPSSVPFPGAMEQFSTH